MKRLLEFIRTTAIGGLLVIIPLTIVLFVLAQLSWGLYRAANSIVSQLGIGAGNAVLMFALLAAALVGVCFATGLLVRTRLGAALQGWFGRKIAPRIPMFRALSNLTKRFVGVEGQEFTPVEVDVHGSAARTLGFLVEELPDNRCAVFLPTAPVITVGNVIVVPRDSVTVLEASVAEAAGIISQWGVDASDLYRGRPGRGRS